MPKPRTRYASPVSLRVPHHLLRDLDKRAKRADVPRSAILIAALEAWLENPGKIRRALADGPVSRPAEGEGNVFE